MRNLLIRAGAGLSRRMFKERRYVDEDLQKNISRKLGKESFTENRIEFQTPAIK